MTPLELYVVIVVMNVAYFALQIGIAFNPFGRRLDG